MLDAQSGRDVLAVITPSLASFRPFCVWNMERDGSVARNLPIPALSPSSTDLGQYVSKACDVEMIESLKKEVDMGEVPRTEFKFPITFSYLPMARKYGHERENLRPILRRVWKCEDLEESILADVSVRDMGLELGGSGEEERVVHELLFMEKKEMSKHKLRALNRRRGVIEEIVSVEKIAGGRVSTCSITDLLDPLQRSLKRGDEEMKDGER